jgi:hypothetical protein
MQYAVLEAKPLHSWVLYPRVDLAMAARTEPFIQRRNKIIHAPA